LIWIAYKNLLNDETPLSDARPRDYNKFNKKYLELARVALFTIRYDTVILRALKF